MDKIFNGYILVSDMDGTLLNSNGKLSRENKEAIEYFISKGGNFTLATGRMVASVGKFLKDINVTLPVILHNGTKIYNYSTDKVIYEEFIEEDRKEIITSIINNNPTFGIEVYSEEKVYIYSSCKYTERFLKLGYDVIYKFPKEVWEKKWTKVLIISEKDEIDILEEEFKDIYGEGTVIRSGERYLEIIPNNMSKGKALKKLIDFNNLHSSKIVAIGDNMNDVEMIELSNYGFYVKNATDRVINDAKLIAPSNDENAIAYVVNWLRNEIINNK